MENGVGMADDSIRVDNKIVEERDAIEKVEERAVEVFDEIKDVEDEVFEEAIGTQEHLQVLIESAEMGDSSGVAAAIGNGETIGDSGSEEVKENLNSEPEAETFEEAIGFPSDVGPQEDVIPSEVGPQLDVVLDDVGPEVDVIPSEVGPNDDVTLSVDEQKVEELMVGENVGCGLVSNNIDEGGTEIGAGTDELTGGKEVPEINGTGEREVLREEDKGNMKSNTGIEKHVHGEADKEDLDRTLAEEKLETLGVDMVEEDVKMDSKLEVLPQVGKVEESREDALATDYQGKRAGESSDTSADMVVKLQDYELEALNDKSTNFDTGDREKESTDVKSARADPDSVDGDEGEKPDNGLATVEAVDNRNGEVKDLSDAGDMKHNGVIDKLKETISDLSTSVEGTGAREFGNLSSSKKLIDQKNEKIKAGKSDLRSEDSVDGDEGEKPTNGLATVEAVDNRNGKVKDSSDAGDMKHNGVIDKLKDTISELSTSVEGTGAREFGNSSSSKKLIDQTNEKIEAGKTDLRSEVYDGFQSQLPDEMMDKVKDIHCVTEESEKKAENDQQDKQSTEVTLEQEMQHAPVSSFSSKAEESGKKADTVQELKQNIPVIREREIPPAPLPSSSLKSINSATPTSHPAGLGRAAPLLEPAPRMVQQPRVNGTVSQAQLQQNEDPANGEAEESDETREKLQLIRVKFLRLAHRLGQTPHNVVVAQVLYRLGLAEQLRGRNGGRVGAFSFDRASAMAEQLEAAGDEPLDFSCTIMVLGKTGVGKSATINSIFDEVKFGTDAFQTGTQQVQDVLGTVHGIKVRVIDTPGLLPSWSDQRQNEKILHSVKRFIKKTPPDIVLYLDRLDMQTRDFGDMPLLRTITEIFGPSLWFNAIVVLTHAASAPPDGPNGTASSYDMFVTQRSHVVQQAIRHAAGDMRLMNPVSLVENHSACRTNRAGQRVLPNGQVWKPHLLLLSFASKILAEANTLLKLQDTPPGKPFATRTRTLPLPFLLSSLLQSRQQVKLPEEQYGDEDSSEDDLVESSDSGDELEYDELPPFKRLTKAQIARLTKAQKKAYFDELEYREKLFMKKQLKEEKKRRKMMKKMAAAAKDLASEYGDNTEEESSGASSVPVPVPDLALPASFDSDNPTHRYRYLDSSNPWLVRPVLDTHGWDHDVGYEGINVERLFVAKDKFPISFSGQITKDKKDANIQMELASSLKHGEGKATSLGFDMQTVGKDLSYTMRSETRFSNFRKNKATAGISVTLLGDALSAGVKVEDKLIANKRFQVVMTGGAMTGRGDLAYGGSLEAQLRDKDYPIGRSSSTLGLSIMDWHGDLAIGCNIQSQVPVGRSTNLIARVNLNNRGAGQVSIRINSTEQLQLALISLLPLLKKLLDYPQQMQY